MECIVSLLVLSILMLSVTTMIRISLVITGNVTQQAKDAQENTYNDMIQGNYVGSATDATITMTATATGLTARHDVTLHDSDGIVAIEPE